ncbi:Radial spoke head 10-like B [Durusdinium trenchii]|uniref:Radial spoke head 10-like B n=1 Tax=Durusdinium trenchii TaxID=1381693 RepID=A0ABP0SKN8_9DINO
MAKEWNMMRDLNAPMGGGQEIIEFVADGGLEEMGEAWEFPSETSYGDGDSVRESTDLYSNGNRYEGQWLDDKRPAAQSSAVRRKRVDGSFDRGHGRGLFACAEDRVNWDGSVYDGEFAYGRKDGLGSQRRAAPCSVQPGKS